MDPTVQVKLNHQIGFVFGYLDGICRFILVHKQGA